MPSSRLEKENVSSLNEGRAFYFSSLQQAPVLSDEEEARLLSAFQKGKKEDASQEEKDASRKAREELSSSLLPMVVMLAGQYESPYASFMDLASAGHQSLLSALDAYDASKETKLSTFAYVSIQNGMRSFLKKELKEANLQNIPYEMYQRIKETQTDLEERGLTADAEAIASIQKDIPMEIVEKALSSATSLVSLDKPKSSGETSLLTSIASSAPLPSDLLDQEETIRRLDEAFASLSPKERFVLASVYGLEGQRKKTMKEIGKTLSLSGERIRQIKLQALHKLRLAFLRR
ncbi:MAG: sigma-70 family RNA polymerase sigma factor [Candidatus Enteromonas sp.]